LICAGIGIRLPDVAADCSGCDELRFPGSFSILRSQGRRMSGKSVRSVLFRQIGRFRGDETGNIAIIFAITLVPLLGGISAAVDYSLANRERTKTQAVLDAAVLAGVQEATSSLQIAKASTFFTAQITNPWGTTPTASFSVDSSGTLIGTATGSVNAQFIKLAGIASIPINVSSSANLKIVTTTTSVPSKVCILLVNPNAAQSLLVNSGANLNAPNCEIDVDSSAGTAAMINSPTALNVKKVCIKGTATQNGGTSAAVSTGCAAIANPFVGKLPAVTSLSCTVNNPSPYNGSTTLSPGVYCGSVNFNGSGTVTFSPGLYVLKNSTMIFNSGWTVTGSGVTFYLADHTIQQQCHRETVCADLRHLCQHPDVRAGRPGEFKYPHRWQ
jgi:Flp pilus assembly protein TadG